MERDMDYIKYCSFLNSIERNFKDQMTGKSAAEKTAMLQLANEMINDFRRIYGDQPRYSEELLKEAKEAAFDQPFNLN